MDANAAAQLIAKLADDDNARNTFGEALRQLAQTTFNMERYVERLDELGREAMATMRQRAQDCQIISSREANLDLTGMLGSDAIHVSHGRLRNPSPHSF